MTATVPLATKLAGILGEVGRIEKRGQIRSEGRGPSYNFARDSDVLEAVNPKMAEQGIVLIPERTQLLSMEPNMRGSQIIANIKTSWHVTDGNESLRFETLGQGQDSGDKALPKAQSNARKYAFFMLFHIVTGDDPDQHASEQPQDGERAPIAGRRGTPLPATTRSAAPSNKGEALSLLADVGHEHGLSFAQIEAKAKAMGVDRGSATVEDILRVIAAIETPASGVPADVAGTGEAEVARAAASPIETAQSEGSPESSGSDAPTSQAGGEPPPVSPPAAAPTMQDVLAVTGGEEVPPAPGTPEYKALPNGTERAKAKAYHDALKKAAESDDTPAEQMRAALDGES